TQGRGARRGAQGGAQVAPRPVRLGAVRLPRRPSIGGARYFFFVAFFAGAFARGGAVTRVFAGLPAGDFPDLLAFGGAGGGGGAFVLAESGIVSAAPWSIAS